MSDAAGRQMQALLGFMRIESVGSDVVRLRVADVAHLDFARKKSDQLQRLVGEALGRSVRIELSAEENSAQERATDDDVTDAMSHPVVREAVELFDASVVHVERTKRSGGDADQEGGAGV